MLDDDPFRMEFLSIDVPGVILFCWLNGALEATIESCSPQVSWTEAIEAIIKHLLNIFIFVAFFVRETAFFSTLTDIFAKSVRFM